MALRLSGVGRESPPVAMVDWSLRSMVMVSADALLNMDWTGLVDGETGGFGQGQKGGRKNQGPLGKGWKGSRVGHDGFVFFRFPIFLLPSFSSLFPFLSPCHLLNTPNLFPLINR